MPTSEIEKHAELLDEYKEMSRLAVSGYPAALNSEQKAAYMLLPDLAEYCLEAWLQIPDAARPIHYLMYAKVNV